MRVCTSCGEAKPDADFFFQDKGKGRLHAQCKLCYKAFRKNYAAEHYRKYGDQYRLRAKTRRAAMKLIVQKQLIAYLADKACVLCGENDPCTLDFDHLDPSQKSYGISKGITDGLSWDKLLLEIQKCRIICSNCHRKHTAKQFGWYKFMNE